MRTAIWILCVVFAALTGSVHAKDVGVVSFTIDNITREFYKDWRPLFEQQKIFGTMYVQTRPVGVESWDMGWNELRQMHASGWEIGAHSYTHEVELTSKATTAELDLELGAPAARIFREIGVYPKTFATPFGAYDEKSLEKFKQYYDAHLKAWGNEGLNDLHSFDPHLINRVEPIHDWTVAEACSRIESAGREGKWLVLMMHGITGHHHAGEYQITAELLKGILSCAAKLRDEGKLKIKTAAEVVQERTRK